MVKYVNPKNGIEFDVMESFIEVDYDSDNIENVDSVKYCVQGVIPGANHVPEVATIDLFSDIEEAIRLHHDIMLQLGLYPE